MQNLDKNLGNKFNPEKFVGIIGYTTTTPPLGGILKKNIADFIVREITPNQEILCTWEKPTQIPQFRSKDKYTIFTLIKKNMDTIHAAKIIYEYLNVSEDAVQWAGIKDNNAITAQRFSVKGNHAEKLKSFKHRDIIINDIMAAHNPMRPGLLWGNYFAINLREIKISYPENEQVLQKWMNEIEEKGFPNFYGLQRFGQFRPNSHLVGKYLFLGDFEKATEEFLFTTYPDESEISAKYRKTWQNTQDYEGALADIPSGLYYEKILLEALVQESYNYKKAFLHLPIPLVNLILSSYQSYLFNRAIAYRLKESKNLNKPITGDIVGILSEPKGLSSLVFYKYGGWNDETILKAFKHHRAVVLAPIVGFRTDLNEFSAFKKIYLKFFKEEGFSQSSFEHSLHKRLFNFEGTFRPISREPTNLKWDQATLIGNPQTIDPNAVHLSFALPKGTYATMFLRELIKEYP